MADSDLKVQSVQMNWMFLFITKCVIVYVTYFVLNAEIPGRYTFGFGSDHVSWGRAGMAC